MVLIISRIPRETAFQCSSASRKFLNLRLQFPPASCRRFSALQRAENSSIILTDICLPVFSCFSALQRAENSSITIPNADVVPQSRFQCSSASRKFLNCHVNRVLLPACGVSVLFSEPKIPQSFLAYGKNTKSRVSVLFSEPKIPQSHFPFPFLHFPARFQCSSASRKFLNPRGGT